MNMNMYDVTKNYTFHLKYSSFLCKKFEYDTKLTKKISTMDINKSEEVLKECTIVVCILENHFEQIQNSHRRFILPNKQFFPI